MTGGLKFYDRTEIKIVLDYLRVISKPESNDALARIINVPSRRIGEPTIKSLLEEADQGCKTLWAVILDAARGNRAPKTKLTEQASKGLSSLVNIILSGRKKLTEGEPSITDMIDHVLKRIAFEDFLTRSYPEDHEQRWANITELTNQANDFSNLISTGYEDETLPEIDGLEQAENPDLLSKFLANVALASDIKKDESDAVPMPQITISTIHAAKGLEWPVVFIPAVYNGHIPHSRAEDTDEERRLLYVAMTRAKALLYMSYPLKNTHHDEATLCQFLTSNSLKHHMEDHGPSLTASVTQCIAQVLRRGLPSEVVIAQSCRTIKSIEDNIWPVDGIEDSKSRDMEWSGKHSYTEGQQPYKKRRLDSEFLGGRSHSETDATYKTTMNQVSGFSVASTTLGSDFMSAGSHLKTLNEQPTTQIADRAAARPRGEYADSMIPREQGALKAPRQSAVLRESKRPAGQGSIASLFTKQQISYKPDVKPLHEYNEVPRLPKTHIKPVATPRLTSIPTGSASILPSAAATRREPLGIQPALANHRIKTAPLAPRRSKLEQEEDIDHKTYVFLSSSPPRSIERPSEQDITLPTSENAKPMNNNTLPAMRPATTMHTTTTMALKNVGNWPRRTLGVRRSMNGWSSRPGQGFTPPTMYKKA